MVPQTSLRIGLRRLSQQRGGIDARASEDFGDRRRVVDAAALRPRCGEERVDDARARRRVHGQARDAKCEQRIERVRARRNERHTGAMCRAQGVLEQVGAARGDLGRPFGADSTEDAGEEHRYRLHLVPDARSEIGDLAPSQKA